MRGAWLVGVAAVLLGAAPAQGAVVSVDANGVMDVQVPEGGNLRVECAKPPGGENYCDVLFSSSIGGQVVGAAPACVPQTIGGRVRCTGVRSRNVTMGSGDDTLTLTASASTGFGALFGGTITMGAGNDTIDLGESYGSDVIVDGAGTDTVRYGRTRFTALNVTVGGGGADGSLAEADDVRAEIVEGGRGADVLTDLAGATTIRGGEGGDVITGGTGANVLDGEFGNDTIAGMDGDDAITGGPAGLPSFIADDDTVDGGPGDDDLDGGSGTDTVSFASATGPVSADLTAASAAGAGSDLVEGFESLIGSAGDDTLIGDDGANRIEGSGGSDAIDARGGADMVIVDDGNVDRVDCGAANDTARGDRTDALENCEIEDLGRAIGLSIVDAEVDEAVGEAVLTLTADGASSRDISVRARTVSGTAGAGTDFSARDDVITIPAGATSTAVRVPIIDDDVDEEDVELFTVALSEPAQAEIADAEASVAIADDEAPPVFSVSAPATVPESGTADFVVTLSSASERTPAVDFATVLGTANAEDVGHMTGTLEFPPGTTSRTVTVPIASDDVDELDETFGLALADPVRAGVGRGTAAVTILDDDTAALSIADAQVTEGSPLAVRVSQSTEASRPVTVRVRTVDGQARAASDYTAFDAVVTIPAGERHADVTISTTPDSANERDETFGVTLTDPAVATIERAMGTITILDDDAKPRPKPRSASIGAAQGDGAVATGSAARCVVPRLRGRTVRSARVLLLRAGCRVRAVERRRHPSVGGSRVAGTSVRPGSSRPSGHAVTLYVSRDAAGR